MLTAVGKQGLVFRICFSGRTLSKYGKLYPINYYGSNDNRGEMEDRLVGDINLLGGSELLGMKVVLMRWVGIYLVIIVMRISMRFGGGMLGGFLMV